MGQRRGELLKLATQKNLNTLLGLLGFSFVFLRWGPRGVGSPFEAVRVCFAVFL